MPGWGPPLGLSSASSVACKGVKQRSENGSTYGMTSTVTAVFRLCRRIWPYAVLAVLALWWLYGWHVGVAALFAFYGFVAWFALLEMISRLASR